jgi:phosphatidylserine decarboxylase
MRHAGRARKAAFRMLLVTLIILVVIWGFGFVAVTATAVIAAVGVAITPFVIIGWMVFAVFTLCFFRDPNARCPSRPGIVVSPAHARIDVIDKTVEAQFMGGECQRISMFLSVLNVHVQNAPVTGTLTYLKHTAGEFLNAMRTESAQHNENVLLGFEATDPAGQRIGVRLIAGVLARRIVPFVQSGDAVVRGERISLIQFGSRADVYLPLSASIKVKLGDKVVGGETVLAAFE